MVPVPGAVDDETDDPARRLRTDDDDDEEEHHLQSYNSDDDSDGTGSSTSAANNANHVHNAKSPYSFLFPNQAHRVFVYTCAFSLILFLAVPVVCLGVLNQVREHREALGEAVQAPHVLARAAVNVARSVGIAQGFSLTGDGFLFPTQSITSTAISPSEYDSSLGRYNYGPSSAAVEAILSGVGTAVTSIAESVQQSTARASSLTVSFFDQTFLNELRAYNTAVPAFMTNALRRYEQRRTMLDRDQSFYFDLFQSVFPSETAASYAQALVLTKNGVLSCLEAGNALCNSSGLALAEEISSNVSTAVYVVAREVAESCVVLAEASVNPNSLEVFQRYEAMLGDRQVMEYAARKKLSYSLAAIRRLVSFQAMSSSEYSASNNATAGEASLMKSLAPSWASHLETVLQGVSDASVAGATHFKQILDENFLEQVRAVSDTVDHAELIEGIGLFDSAFSISSLKPNLGGVLGPASTADLTSAATRFQQNPMTTFPRRALNMYSDRISAALGTLNHLVARETANDLGESGIVKIQIATAVCLIAAALLIPYLLFGISLRLRGSYVPFPTLVVWIAVCFGIFIAAPVAIAMISIHDLSVATKIEAGDVSALQSAATVSLTTAYGLHDAARATYLVAPSLDLSAIAATATAALTSIPSTSTESKALRSAYSDVLTNMTSIASRPAGVRDWLAPLSSLSPTLDLLLEGASNFTVFTSLPVCNQSRIASTLILLLDSYAITLRHMDLAVTGTTVLKTRTHAGILDGARTICCRCDRTSVSQQVMCANRRKNIGLLMHPRFTDSPSKVLYLDRSSRFQASLDSAVKASNVLTANAAAVISAKLEVQKEAWIVSRRTIVWLAVSVAVGLQGLMYGVYKATFGHTVHSQLLP